MLVIGYDYSIRSECRLCSEVHLSLANRWIAIWFLTVPCQPSTFSKDRYNRFERATSIACCSKKSSAQCCLASLVTSEVCGGRQRCGTHPACGQWKHICRQPCSSERSAVFLTYESCHCMECEGRTRQVGHFSNYLIDTEHAVMVDVQATSSVTACIILSGSFGGA